MGVDDATFNKVIVSMAGGERYKVLLLVVNDKQFEEIKLKQP